MSKGKFFTGQPIFNQILNFIPRTAVTKISRQFNADRYCKSFRTYEHLVTMLYGIFNQCTSLREVTTGMLAWEKRIHHLGMTSHPSRSTLADANKRRPAEVFEKIYYALLEQYGSVLPDSRMLSSRKSNLYIFDSTSIALFKEILKGSGLSKADGRRKGGIKVHTLLRADQDVPCMVRFSEGAANDSRFLKDVYLPQGSVVVFDKGYRDYATYNRFTAQRVTWVTRHRDNSVYAITAENEVNEYQRARGISVDNQIILGHAQYKKQKAACRMITYTDPVSKKVFQFITNNNQLAPSTIAGYYQRRWQIEVFFKRIKQSFPLQYFLGDNDNAIKTQIWCALIADLLLKVIRRGTRSRLSFSNTVCLVRLHLMTYMDLKSFLRAPEKTLRQKIKQSDQTAINPTLFGP